MATIYRNSENKYTAAKLIFGNDVSPYCYHDFALTKKMTKEELCEAVFNGALYVDAMSNDGCSDNTPLNEFKYYQAILLLDVGPGGHSNITISSSPDNIVRHSAEYTA